MPFNRSEEEHMSKPNVADTQPAETNVQAGETYYWCACGKSTNQPFCDGSHEEEGVFNPLPFTPEEDGTVYLCQCKHTGNQPYCDGTHENI
jgi:CDGSH-type Zn-finger protein